MMDNSPASKHPSSNALALPASLYFYVVVLITLSTIRTRIRRTWPNSNTNPKSNPNPNPKAVVPKLPTQCATATKCENGGGGNRNYKL